MSFDPNINNSSSLRLPSFSAASTDPGVISLSASAISDTALKNLCTYCNTKYDLKNHKPMFMASCAHEACMDCIENNKCPDLACSKISPPCQNWEIMTQIQWEKKQSKEIEGIKFKFSPSSDPKKTLQEIDDFIRSRISRAMTASFVPFATESDKSKDLTDPFLQTSQTFRPKPDKTKDLTDAQTILDAATKDALDFLSSLNVDSSSLLTDAGEPPIPEAMTPTSVVAPKTLKTTLAEETLDLSNYCDECYEEFDAEEHKPWIRECCNLSLCQVCVPEDERCGDCDQESSPRLDIQKLNKLQSVQ